MYMYMQPKIKMFREIALLAVGFIAQLQCSLFECVEVGCCVTISRSVNDAPARFFHAGALLQMV